MIDKAIEKLNAEMQKDAGDRYLEIIGHYVIDRCDGAVAAGVAAGKTLKGAMDAVMARAKKAKRRGIVAVLTPEEMFGEVDRYFGLAPDTAAQWRALGMSPAHPAPPAGGVIDLADFF